MDLKQLTALVTVSEVGSVTRAAQLLHVVQPAVTRQIRTLEQELGVALFARTRQGMVPTREGDLLVTRARRALQELDRARAEITPDPTEVRGIVALGVLESIAELLVPPLVRVVADQLPGVELRLLSAYSGHLQEWLDAGEVDLSLLYNLAPTPALSVVPLLTESLWAVAPPDAALDPNEPIALERVWEQPLVLAVAGHGLRVLVDQARADSGADVRVAHETNSMTVQKQLVAMGQGWTLLPASGVARDVAAGRLTGAPLAAPGISRSVVLGLPRGGRISPQVEAVATQVLRVVRRLVSAGTWPSATATLVEGR